MNVSALWPWIWIIIQAVVLGLIVESAGALPISLLVTANLRHGVAFPWGSLVEAILLSAYCGYLTGWGWPKSTSAFRRRRFRANRIEVRLFWPATLATTALAFSIALLTISAYMLERIPESAGKLFLDVSAAPSVTAVTLMVTIAVASGIVEEVAFRGYMQVSIEDHSGPIVAITVVAVAFALAHSVSGFGLVLFVVGATGWSVLAWLVDSTVPGMIAHASVDVVLLLWVWHDPQQFRELMARSLSETGPDRLLLTMAALTAVSVGASCLAFLWLARTRAGLLVGGSGTGVAG